MYNEFGEKKRELCFMKIHTKKPHRTYFISKIRNSVLFILCFAFQFGNAQIPPLGDVEKFALFSNGGDFNNTGNTIIVGDIGTQVGAFTGFPPGVFSGQAHIADTTSVRIATLVSSLYAYFFGLTADSVIGVGLGNNQVLPPNIYSIGAATTINGNLILDAQGDPNAVFIFKIGGALTTSTFSSVSLINSASICNVYWQVNGLFSLADSSVFRGTLIANGEIILANGATLEGRALTIAGAININNVLADITCLNSVLPICLTNFQVTCNDGLPSLQWSTSSEINNDYFILYRSRDGKIWEQANEQKGAGNSYITRTYRFIDYASFPEYTYYCLKQVDYNGETETSAIVWINSCNQINSSIKVYPNPSKGMVNISPLETKPSLYSLSVYNSSGAMVYGSKKFRKSIDLSKFENGRYTLRFSIDGVNSVQEIIISK